VPTRIYSRASDGKTYVPHDAYHRIGRLGEHFFHSDGKFVLEVPEGELVLEAMRGFEYYPVVQKVQVTGNQITPVVLKLKRMINMKALGWYSGSNHVHMNYGGNLHNRPENLLFMARAEDLNVVTDLVANKDNRILDYQYFTGRLHPLSSDNLLLYFNEEYRPPFYGHMALINLTRQLISPFTTGYEGTAIESLYPSNTDILRLVRKQGALGAYVHPFRGDDDPLQKDLGNARAFPVDLALGALDYHELMSFAGWADYRVWWHALNNGFKIPVAAGEDSITNLHNTPIIGQDRVYAYLGPKLSWDGWIQAIRKGHSFVTNGPLLELDIEKQIPGGEIHLPASGRKVRVRGKVESIVPLDRAELVVNGKPTLLTDFRGEQETHGGTQYQFDKEIDVKISSWITLQAYGSRPTHPVDDGFPQATTNPIWIYVGDVPIGSVESTQYFIRWIDKLIALAEAHPGWRSQKERDHVLSQFKEARTVYEKLLQQGAQSRPR
jgi:hypothetical protein